MKSEPATVAYEAFRELFALNRQPTKRVLVEFYKADWDRISEVKEELDLSWKEFFHAISLWLNVLESNSEAHQLIANLVTRKEGGR